MKNMDCCEEEENVSRHESRIKIFFSRFFHGFMITGESRVKRQKLTKEDFELPEDCKVAQYDPERVANYWNSRNLSQPIGWLLLHLVTRGIYAKLLPVASLYVTLYYVLNIFVFNPLLCTNAPSGVSNNSTSHSNSNGGTQGLVRLALSGNALCQKAKFQEYMAMERDFTRVLTLFIGFTVSLSVSSWSSQVRMVPKLDQLLVQINNYLWVNPNQNIGNIKVKGDVSAKQLRITIIRYFLLSWTMCFSRISRPMNEKFKNAHALNRKELMLKREFDELSCGTERDSWREKWTTPLSWVTKMVNDIEVKNNKSVKILDVKDAIGKTVGAYCHDLQRLNSYNEYRMPSSLINLLTITLYVFLILNVAAAQDMHPEKKEPGILNEIILFVFDFPVYPLVKYFLIFGWLQVATDLMVPFGCSR